MTKASDQRDASTSVDEKVQKKARQLRLAIAFLVGAAVLAAFLLATGVLTLRPMFGDGLAPCGRVERVGCVVKILTTLDGAGDGSAFGHAFFRSAPRVVIWTV